MLPIGGAGDVIWVHARSQIAHTRAIFERFSEMSENRRAEWWRGGIRTPETLWKSMGGNRPEFGPLFAAK